MADPKSQTGNFKSKQSKQGFHAEKTSRFNMHTKNHDQVEPSHFTGGKILNESNYKQTDEQRRGENPFSGGATGANDIDLLHEQQPTSIWASLFEGFKRLFNMNSDPEQVASPPPNAHDPLRNSYNNIRNSAHRGLVVGIAPGHNDSGTKNRHSYL